MSSANRPQLRKINLSSEQSRAKELARAYSGEEYTLLKEGNSLFAFKEGRFAFRFVTQPEGAREGFAVTVPHIYIDANVAQGMRGYLPLTVGQASLMDNVRRALYNSEFKEFLSSETNKNGISLSVKFKTLFVGLLHGDIRPRLHVVGLPSNGYSKPKKGNIRLQCGTIIMQFAYDTNLKGEPKYPDLFDLDEGRLIVVEVTGSGDRTEYTPSVDIKFPLDEDYYDTLSKVPKFEDIIHYQADDVLLTYLKKRLPTKMWEFVVAKLQLDLPEAVAALSVPVTEPANAPTATPTATREAPAAGAAPASEPAAAPTQPKDANWSGKSTESILAELKARGIAVG